MADADVDDFLRHHGVLGMKWHHHKAQDVVSSARAHAQDVAGSPEMKKLVAGVEKLTSRDKTVLNAAGVSPLQAESMKAKYGPDSAGPERKKLTPAQKKLIIAGVVGVGLVGLAAYGVHAENASTLDGLIKAGYNSESAKDYLKRRPEEAKALGGMVHNGIKPPTAKYLVQSDFAKAAHVSNFSVEDAAKLSREDLSFPAGHVFNRVSTEAERQIRPSGFYASHLDSDTERYKAVLPVYWKLWNPVAPPTRGFVNHYVTDGPLKVANDGTVYDVIKKSLDTADDGPSLRKLIGAGTKYATDDELVSKNFHDVVGKFIDPEDPVTKKLTKILQSEGYRGIVDSNDKGSLAESPIKFLSGAGFKIASRDVLGPLDIASAQDAIQALKHFLKALLKGGTMPTVIRDPDLARQDLAADFLRHHGVLGMKWGHHRAEGGDSGGSKPSYHERRAGIIDARHDQIALRKSYMDARKAGDDKGAEKIATQFKNSNDRVVADHLTRGEKAATLLLPGVGGQIVAARTARSTQLSKSAIATRQAVALATTAIGPLAGVVALGGAYGERKVIESTIDARKKG